jgi:electron transfer flavoprotein beta subunit
MKIIVCVKRVPDSETQVKIAPDGVSLDVSDVDFVMNPYEEYAVEAALQLVEAQGGEVTVLCLGPAAATKEIRQALAMGANDAIHLVDDGYAADPYATARALADCLRGETFDLLLFGKTAIDDGSFAVGPMVAGLLNLPSASGIDGLELADGSVTVQMPVEGGAYKLRLPLPAVLTIDKGLNEPRYPTLRGIMQAKRKKVDSRDTSTPDSRFVTRRMYLPPPRPAGRIVGEGVEAVPEVVRLLREEAKVL